MVPNVYKPGLLQIRPQYTTDPDSGDTPENVTWWLSATTSTPSLADLTNILGVFDPAWGALYAAYGTSTKDFTGAVITDWSSASGLQQTSVGVFTPVPGTQSSPTPPQVALLQSYQIQLRWRGGHFRTYYPYVGVSALTGSFMDTIDPAVITAVEAAYTTVVTDMAGSGVLGGQAPRMYKDKTNPATATLYPPVSQRFQTIVATQRRRVRHVGRR